jgi:hypothetical protein
MKFEKGGASSATLFWVIRPLASRRFDRGAIGLANKARHTSGHAKAA